MPNNENNMKQAAAATMERYGTCGLCRGPGYLFRWRGSRYQICARLCGLPEDVRAAAERAMAKASLL